MTDTVADSEPAPPPLAEPDAATTRKPHSLRRNLEWVAIIVVAILSAVLVKTYLVEAFYIPSASMEPTLRENDRVLVNKLSYRLHEVHRGDIVVFERPPNVGGDQRIHDFIKRVIAVGGDTVETRGDVLYVNDKKLKEPYLAPGTVTASPGITRRTIPPKQYWVMGDNRGNSSDSRIFGPIKESTIVGRAFLRVWPVSRLKTL